jgi:hypothetical protein
VVDHISRSVCGASRAIRIGPYGLNSDKFGSGNELQLILQIAVDIGDRSAV